MASDSNQVAEQAVSTSVADVTPEALGPAPSASNLEPSTEDFNDLVKTMAVLLANVAGGKLDISERGVEAAIKSVEENKLTHLRIGVIHAIKVSAGKALGSGMLPLKEEIRQQVDDYYKRSCAHSSETGSTSEEGISAQKFDRIIREMEIDGLIHTVGRGLKLSDYSRYILKQVESR